MVQFNALTTKNGKMVRAVKVLDPFWVLLAQLIAQILLVLIVEVEVGLCKHVVFFNDFIEDVDVERKALWTFKLLDELTTDGASYAVLVVQLVNAVSA